ncbi:hypothetical protein [Paenibacillus agilis]|uniref:Uncharacterized protein n=1 Tax=Paenibacillus agilis TaxID=3020863 RepID=A0A559IDD4_9BACL|nr:hypothetical protein [Paenibacillus agilis]TVX85540.1 hypothetical protein FPZ44_24600 [Paenibacillus agilis]
MKRTDRLGFINVSTTTTTITDTKTLRSVLEARIKTNQVDINRLAHSAKPEDNYLRLQLIGANDVMFQILAQIG